MDLTTKRNRLLAEEDLCNHCLGRQFGEVGYGLENYERGALVRENDKLRRQDFTPRKVPDETKPGGSCRICAGVFNKLEQYTARLVDAVQDYELDTILIGTRIPEVIERKEAKLQETYGAEQARSIKSELNRLLGKRVQIKLDVEADFKQPDITAILDLNQEEVELEISSVLVYGQYNKYCRNLPQTKLFCRTCRGAGCPDCNQQGRQYLSSVQEVIQPPFIKAARAEEVKFHGAGREDIDARCFGKREFILELIRPQVRNLNYPQLKEKVNQTQDKVEIFNLKPTNKNKIKKIKQKRADKTYRAVVTLTQKVTENQLNCLQDLVGTIRQRTPQRVAERRPDMIRERDVYLVKAEMIAPKKLDLVVKAQAGAYIKELISGDQDRTKPNASQLLGCQAECEKLDIIDIDN